VETTIGALAATVAQVFGGGMKIWIARPPNPEQAPERYVPCVDRALDDLGLRPVIDLEEAIRRTIAWHRQRSKASEAP
jgi:nucleoside-diphosphate-sugar epimerase